MRDDTDNRVPAPEGKGQRISLKRLWHQLPAASRRDTLCTLSRILARSLPTPPRKEAGHEPR